jgi:hypothetical protein
MMPPNVFERLAKLLVESVSREDRQAGLARVELGRELYEAVLVNWPMDMLYAWTGGLRVDTPDALYGVPFFRREDMEPWAWRLLRVSEADSGDWGPR